MTKHYQKSITHTTLGGRTAASVTCKKCRETYDYKELAEVLHSLTMIDNKINTLCGSKSKSLLFTQKQEEVNCPDCMAMLAAYDTRNDVTEEVTEARGIDTRKQADQEAMDNDATLGEVPTEEILEFMDMIMAKVVTEIQAERAAKQEEECEEALNNMIDPKKGPACCIRYGMVVTSEEAVTCKDCLKVIEETEPLMHLVQIDQTYTGVLCGCVSPEGGYTNTVTNVSCPKCKGRLKQYLELLEKVKIDMLANLEVAEEQLRLLGSMPSKGTMRIEAVTEILNHIYTIGKQ